MSDAQAAFEAIWPLYENSGIDKLVAMELFALGSEYACERIKRVILSSVTSGDPPEPGPR